MAEGLGGRPGGILEALALLEDEAFSLAVERELIGLGLRLRWLADGTDRLSWRDFIVVVRECAADSPIMRWNDPEGFGWGVGEYLTAAAVDALHGANWQRSGGKGKRPEPMPLPGRAPQSSGPSAENVNPKGKNEDGVFRGEVMSTSDMAEFMGWTLTPEEKIVAAYKAGGQTYRSVAARFGVSASTVGRLVRASRN